MTTLEFSSLNLGYVHVNDSHIQIGDFYLLVIFKLAENRMKPGLSLKALQWHLRARLTTWGVKIRENGGEHVKKLTFTMSAMRHLYIITAIRS